MGVVAVGGGAATGRWRLMEPLVGRVGASVCEVCVVVEVVKSMCVQGYSDRIERERERLG